MKEGYLTGRRDVFISFIMPVYNGEKHIERTINSVIYQPDNAFELIIVNDGSFDSSCKIINDYVYINNKIIFIESTNQGVSHARNIGIKVAKGKYIVFLDHDDIIIDNSVNNTLISKLNDYYEKHVDIIAYKSVVSNYELSKCNIEDNSVQTKHIYNNIEKDYMISKCPIHFALYSAKLIKDNGIYCFEQYKKCDTDNTFTHLLFYNSDSVVVDNDIILYCWINNPDSCSHKIENYIDSYMDVLRAWKEAMDIHIKNSDLVAANYCGAWICGNYYYLLIGYYKKYFLSNKLKKINEELNMNEIIEKYHKVDNPNTIKGLDLYYNHRFIFICKSRLEKYKLWIVQLLKKSKFFRRYIDNQKYYSDLPMIQTK